MKLEDDNAQVSFSLVIPAYNEELRICKMLEEAVVYLKNRQKQDRTTSFSFEIIVVDDGSRDRTCQVVLDFASCHPGSNIRLLKFVKNRGKGGAVTQASSGQEDYFTLSDMIGDNVGGSECQRFFDFIR